MPPGALKKKKVASIYSSSVHETKTLGRGTPRRTPAEDVFLDGCRGNLHTRCPSMRQRARALFARSVVVIRPPTAAGRGGRRGRGVAAVRRKNIRHGTLRKRVNTARRRCSRISRSSRSSSSTTTAWCALLATSVMAIHPTNAAGRGGRQGRGVAAVPRKSIRHGTLRKRVNTVRRGGSSSRPSSRSRLHLRRTQ